MKRSIRPGFTLVELLVVITIIGLLMALLIPAVNMALGTARTSQCLNNMRQLGIAMQNRATTKGSFPGYLNSTQLTANVANAIGNQAPLVNNRLSMSWAAELLVDVDRQDVMDAIKDGRFFMNGFEVPRIEVFVCPTDVKPIAGAAALSYVVNTGTWDNGNANGAGQVIDSPANGVCHNRHALVPNTLKVEVGVGQIRDGSSTTLLISENIHKYDNFDWTYGTEQQLGMVWVINMQPVGGDDSIENQERINQETFPIPSEWGPNIPRYARPASNHPSGVNVIFCDGHGEFLQEDIDYTVYQRLLTPHGTKVVDPRNISEPPSNNVIQSYRLLPPLSEADFK